MKNYLILSKLGIACSVVFAILGILLAIAGVVAFDSVEALIFGLLLAAMCIWCTLYIKKELRKGIAREEKLAETKRKERLLQFYRECLAAGVQTLEKEGQRQKASLIAAKYYKAFELEALIEEGKTLHEELALRDKNAAEAKLVAEDRKAHAELTKYANLRGREKTIQMLNDQRKAASEELNKFRSLLQKIMNGDTTIIQNEKSWGLAGGIASAIAGPAAGVAAAIDVQNENARIRQANEEQIKEAAAYYIKMEKAFSPKMSELQKTIDKTTEKIEKARTMLVQDDVSNECFARLQFTDTEVTVSTVGSATIKVCVQVDPFMIFEDTPAGVDGSIFAHIMHKDQEVGQAILTFPEYGTSYKNVRQKVVLTGIALFCCDPEKEYTVTFSPRDLWAAEDITV